MLVLQLHPVAQKVVELLEPHIERQGFELVSVEFRKGTRSSGAAGGLTYTFRDAGSGPVVTCGAVESGAATCRFIGSPPQRPRRSGLNDSLEGNVPVPSPA